jgi:hypothetical protein
VLHFILEFTIDDQTAKNIQGGLEQNLSANAIMEQTTGRKAPIQASDYGNLDLTGN